jgi:multiple sugar transport system permease protein
MRSLPGSFYLLLSSYLVSSSSGASPTCFTISGTRWVGLRNYLRFDFGYAAAAATVLLAVTLVLVYLQLLPWGEES